VALAAALLLVSGCKNSSSSSGSESSGVANKTQLVFGFSYSATGANANEGKLMADGYKFWADTVNSKGGLKVGGKSLKVALKSYDDQSVNTNAATNTQKLITDDKVDFILGPYGSANNIAAEVVTEKNRYIMMDTEGASTDIFANGVKYVVTNGPLANQYPTEAINFLAAQSPKPVLGVVYADDSFSKQVGAAACAQGKDQGLQVAVCQQYPTGNKDYSTLINQLKSANVTAVFAAGHADEALQIVQQEGQLGFKPTATIQTVGPSTPSFAQQLGPAAENQFGTSSWVSTLSFKDDLFGSAADYATNFKKAFNYDPDYHNAQATAGAELLGMAIQKANSLDQDKVLAALKSLSVTTFQAPFQPKPDGTNGAAFQLLGQVQSGKFTSVFPDKYGAAKPVFPAK
jgi:branched-chain amino acid transport system substrate-binding protein